LLASGEILPGKESIHRIGDCRGIVRPRLFGLERIPARDSSHDRVIFQPIGEVVHEAGILPKAIENPFGEHLRGLLVGDRREENILVVDDHRGLPFGEGVAEKLDEFVVGCFVPEKPFVLIQFDKGHCVSPEKTG
jgi:hypothetical protein